ncbi:hypothetical protein CK203_054889 [Vitis vinifera]|uniref:Reverse transcriptase zinc-binding domain-containing protein n=1 Tax=Vitis vinifera TaxID=29760 RepID=A0A438GAV7_VITVI|nr:hypothetical protein CK203_054889 [Vitis vinifera]
MCCPKASRTSFPWLSKGMSQWRKLGIRIWGQGGWNLRLLRAFNDWELDMVGNLLVELREYKVTLEEDSVIWKEGDDGLFKVKKAYNMLANPEGVEFPYSNVWVDKVSTKIAFFAWEAAWGRSSLWIGCREEGGNSLTDASCVGVKRKRSIIF